MKDRHPPIDDVAAATSWWARFGRLASSRRAEELALAAAGDGPMDPYRAPKKVGRNEQCPCGSGKKYKATFATKLGRGTPDVIRASTSLAAGQFYT
jgi:hypothetical protein